MRERGLQQPWDALNVAGMLRDLPGVTQVDIEYDIVGDLAWIDAVPGAKHLGVRCSKIRKNVALSNPLDSLTSLDISGHHSLVALNKNTVAYLAVTDYKGTELSDLSPASLVSLKLTRARQLADVSALRNLDRLREVDIYSAPKLVDISPILRSAAQAVRFASCRSLRLTHDGAVNLHLRSLALVDCGDIGTIELLRGARELATIQLSGTSVSDGKIGFLSELPALTDIRIEHKKHYDQHFLMPQWSAL